MHRIRQKVAWVIVSIFLSSGGAAFADRATDLVFSSGVLENIPTHNEVLYRHQRLGPKDDSFASILDGTFTLTVEPASVGGSEAILEMINGGKVRSRTPFPADAGNPLVMAFLESSLRAMAQITGGSPFYIRNRMKEALRSGGEVQPVKVDLDGTQQDAFLVSFHPFVNDQNADRMGEFSGLELSFVVSPNVPGGFVSFTAATPERGGAQFYRETVEYSALRLQE